MFVPFDEKYMWRKTLIRYQKCVNYMRIQYARCNGSLHNNKAKRIGGPFLQS